MRTIHYYIDFFEMYKNKLLQKKIDFEVVKTSYSKTLNTRNKRIIFNDEGKDDKMTLCLINKVRKDAKMFSKQKIEENKEYKNIRFFDIFQKPKSEKIISKIDIKSAYWNYALKNNIISEETNRFLIEKFSDRTTDQYKKIRLKALGSLATTKIKEYYEKGIIIPEKTEIKTEETKHIYMDICRGIDNLMKECVANVKDCIYYYWDCIFVSSEFEKDAIEFFRDYNYETSVKKTTLEIIKIGRNYYLLSKADDKMYMTRREDSNLIINNNIEYENFKDEILLHERYIECKKIDNERISETIDILSRDENWNLQEDCPF